MNLTHLYSWKKCKNTIVYMTNLTRITKNKFIRLNCWKKIAGKFNIEAEEAEKRYKNLLTVVDTYEKENLFRPVHEEIQFSFSIYET